MHEKRCTGFGTDDGSINYNERPRFVLPSLRQCVPAVNSATALGKPHGHNRM